MELTKEQLEIQQQIIDYGTSNGYSNDLIQVAVNIAYIESSLGANLTNSGSTAKGLYQYLAGTWSEFHSSLGDVYDTNNQITAFYSDLQTYYSWYSSPATNGNIPSTISFAEYAYIKHYQGRSFDQFLTSEALGIYDAAITEDVANTLDVAWPGGGQNRRLCVAADLYNGDAAYEDYDSVNCIKLGDEGDPSTIYIDRNLEAGLSDDERQQIIGSSPTSAFYFCPI